MYFINEKAGAMSTNGKPVNFENGLPALYRPTQYKHTDTGAGFWIYRPNGTSMGETWSVNQAMKWIYWEIDD